MQKLVFVCVSGIVGLLAARKILAIRSLNHAADEQRILYVAAKSLELYVPWLKLKIPDGFSHSRAAKTPRAPDDFKVWEFLDQLDSNEYGKLVYHAPRMPSTHTFLSQNIHSLPVGTVCIADVQDQGKGRAGNVWVSPKGCLMFSFTTQMEDGRLVPFVQYVVCLAVVSGIEAVCSGKKEGLIPEVRIKWPNDLYIGDLKIGGVLCTSTYSSKVFHIVAGVGLNVDNDKPTTCLNSVLSALDPASAPLEREELLARILKSFEELFTVFKTQGFVPLEEMYYKRWKHSGQKVVIEERDGFNSAVTRTPVVIEGLTSAGFLLASDEESNQYELHPDGNSLDFFNGLVRRKL